MAVPLRTLILSIIAVSLASSALAQTKAAAPVPVPGFGNVPDAVIQTLFAGTSPTGKRLSAAELNPLVVHGPRPPSNLRVVGYMNLKIGVFLLTVRSDGTVTKVETLQSTGAALADSEVKNTFKKWRFRPNSVSAVRVPAYYNRG